MKDGYGYLDIEANVTIEIVQSNWFGSKFIMETNMYVLFALEASGMVPTVKSSSKGAATPSSICCSNIDQPYTTRINTGKSRFTTVMLIILRPSFIVRNVVGGDKQLRDEQASQLTKSLEQSSL
ncbi:hypothetical protein LWI29_014004 [Acer saccharum]|uniref:Uncharacterized protein n=1 Tax=Acer saccharum TaxID=4024 RepID=A0AA39SSI0_ACESA|nr:hypothetical protein LWI29_014004 [Acer saccharum]